MKKEYITPNVNVLRFSVEEELTTTPPTLSDMNLNGDDMVDDWND